MDLFVWYCWRLAREMRDTVSVLASDGPLANVKSAKRPARKLSDFARLHAHVAAAWPALPYRIAADGQSIEYAPHDTLVQMPAPHDTLVQIPATHDTLVQMTAPDTPENASPQGADDEPVRSAAVPMHAIYFDPPSAQRLFSEPPLSAHARARVSVSQRLAAAVNAPATHTADLPRPERPTLPERPELPDMPTIPWLPRRDKE